MIGQYLQIEEFGWKYWQFGGDLQGPNGYLLLSRLARDADNASANDPKNEFDAWDDKS